ncbi:hypothetical protein FTX61_15180 [Nitriliruptoraceae bacterium ZYF776]|nr:hypothetical protein [Profundirhabdus halotolerans]
MPPPQGRGPSRAQDGRPRARGTQRRRHPYVCVPARQLGSLGPTDFPQSARAGRCSPRPLPLPPRCRADRRQLRLRARR